MTDLSVIICAHNPRPDYLCYALDALASQSLPKDQWQLLVIDNASREPLASRYDLSWHPRAIHIREEQLGLTHARLRGFQESKGDILIYVDDDNVLDRTYLQAAKDAMERDDTLGACGGRVIPVYEQAPPAWFSHITVSLACQDLGDQPIYFAWGEPEGPPTQYPAGSPSGAGIVLRRESYRNYVEQAVGQELRLNLGRKGSSLASGEDNDMVLTIMSRGYRSAYLPQLRLEHLIPRRRVDPFYLAALGHAANRSWYILHHIHGMTLAAPIAGWTVPARKAVTFFGRRAWRSWPNYIGWRQYCGQLEGRADVHRALQRSGGRLSRSLSVKT